MVTFNIDPARTALLVVDLQRVFVDGSPVAAPDGPAVLRRLNQLAGRDLAAVWERWWAGIGGTPGEIVWDADASDLAAVHYLAMYQAARAGLRICTSQEPNLARRQQQWPQPTRPPGEADLMSKPTILAVDDDPDVSAAITLSPAKHGLPVTGHARSTNTADLPMRWRPP